MENFLALQSQKRGRGPRLLNNLKVCLGPKQFLENWQMQAQIAPGGQRHERDLKHTYTHTHYNATKNGFIALNTIQQTLAKFLRLKIWKSGPTFTLLSTTFLQNTELQSRKESDFFLFQLWSGILITLVFPILSFFLLWESGKSIKDKKIRGDHKRICAKREAK